MCLSTDPISSICNWTNILEKDSAESFIFGYAGTDTQEKDKHYNRNSIEATSNVAYVRMQPKMPEHPVIFKLRQQGFVRAPTFQGLVFDPVDIIQIKRGTFTSLDFEIMRQSCMILHLHIVVFLILVFVYFSNELCFELFLYRSIWW